jgi:hypothetical protein
MGWLDKLIPNEVKSVAKPFQKFSKKFVPKEIRPWLPMVTPFLPMTGIMRGMGGIGGFGKMYAANLLSQAMADPDSEFDDLNQLSALLAGTQGGLMGKGTAGNLRDRIVGGPDRSFWTKTKDLGLEGLASASDYLQGGAETLGALGSGEQIQVGMEKGVPIMGDVFSLGGAKEALKAATVPLSHGMGDVAQAYAKPEMRKFEKERAAEEAEWEAGSIADEQEQADLTMRYYREAGHDEETIQTALELNDLSEYYEPPVEAAQGGIIGLRNGGMLNLGGNEMDYRGGGFVPIGKKERADDVPARLSKNEFVMTADAVKAAGGGSVNKGAQRMYNIMNQLEARA